MSTNNPHTERYAKVIEVSKRVRWEIERDVIRGRGFDYDKTFLPTGLSLVDELGFLSPADQRLLSQVQGRTYAYMFGLVERFIAAKVIQLAQAKALDDQVALEALVRMTDEELKHQALFRRLESMMAADMPAGYVMTADADAVAQAVLGASTWAVLALTLDIELFSQAHYRASIEPDANLSPLWKDVFLFHWREESQHAILDELELIEEDARLSKAAARRRGRRSDRAGRRGGRHPAGPGRGRRRLLRRHRRHHFQRCAEGADPRVGAQGLPLAVHRLRRDGTALPEAAVRAGRRGPGRAHPGGTGAADVRRAATTPSAAADGSLNPTPGPGIGRSGQPLEWRTS